MTARKFMVVEDERLVAEDIAECLRSRGYEVCAICNNGADAVAAAHEHNPDLVMMDIVIQGEMDGIDTAIVLREELEIPVIFLTAYSQEGILERAKTVEPLGYVVKPFEEGTLLSTVEMALHKNDLDQNLRRSKEWFSTTLEAIGDGVIATDEVGNVKFLNKVAEKLCGWKLEDITGRHIEEIFRILNVHSRKKVVNPALKALETGNIIELEKDTNLIRKDGTEFPIEDSGAPIYNSDREIVGSVLVFRDVTQKKKAEEEVRRYQGHLEELVEKRTRALASRIEMERVATEISADLIRLSEDTFDDGVNNALRRIGEMLQIDSCTIYEKVTIANELRYRPKYFWMGEKGNVENLEVLPDGAQDAYMVWLQQLESEGIVVINDLDSLPAEAASERELLESMEISSSVIIGLSDGSPPRLCASFANHSVRHWSEHDLVMFRMLAEILQNVMERREMETRQQKLREQLSQAQKLEAIGKLTGGIAHDFNNMLVPIMGYADSILAGTDSEMSKDDILEIRKAAESAAALTRQLLAFSRKQILVKKPVNLNGLVSDMKQMLTRLLGEDIQVHLDLEENLPHIEADRSQLEQVLLNLSLNARDAMSEGGKLTIQTFSGIDSKGVRTSQLKVTDTGCGMDEKQLEKIFDPFFTTKGMEGTGLGLSVVLGVIEQHDGEITVRSEPGKGTTFTISIASCDARSETTRVTLPKPQNKAEGCGRRILLVEDEPAVLLFVSRALSSQGYEIEAAECKTDAIEIFDREQGKFDMIFTDAKLPDGTGIEVLEHVLKTHPDIPALISSGYTDDRALVDQARGRGVEFLQKPYALDQLHSTVIDVIGEMNEPVAGEVALSG